MNFIKVILLALLASILFFVYLEVEKTNTSVTMSQLGKPKNEHVIYREGKRIVLSNEEYVKLKAIPAITPIKYRQPIEVKEEEEVVEKIEKEIETLKLEGSIPDGVTYQITVWYSSDSKGMVCGDLTFSLGLWGGESGFYFTNSTKRLIYRPTIKDGHHSLEVPLNKFTPLIGCGYHVSFISMQVTNSNLDKYNVNYGGRFNLFYPEEKAPTIYRGDPYNHNAGRVLNLECTSKDFSDKVSYFNPNCHLQSTIDTFFPFQKLKYDNYELNINTTTQDEYEFKRFFKNKIYSSRVEFMQRISRFSNFYDRDLSYFMQKIEQLERNNEQIDTYIAQMQQGISKIVRENRDVFSDREMKSLEGKLKTLEKSAKANQEMKKLHKELLFSADKMEELDALNGQVKLDELFLNNEYYKYEILHILKLSKKRLDFTNKLYDLKREYQKVQSSFGRSFLNCQGYYAKTHKGLCEALQSITSIEKEQDKKAIFKNISYISTILFLSNRRNLGYAIKAID